MHKFKIKLNTDSYDRIMDMSPCLKETVQTAVVDSLIAIKKQWENLAKSNLRSGKAAYLDGLSLQISKDGLSGSVVLQGDFPIKLENGSPPYDLKELFAQSSKVKFSKKTGGWYIDIPIRQGTPNSVNISSTLNNSVYSQAKKLPNWGVLRTTQGSTESWNGYQYTASTYDRLTKIIQSSGGRASYMTWRRVSDKSNPMSWMHPGFAGVHLSDQIVPYANSILDSTVKKYINQVFGF